MLRNALLKNLAKNFRFHVTGHLTHNQFLLIKIAQFITHVRQ